MYTLLFLLLQVLTITGWQLVLSVILIMISISGGIWRVDRARKKDMDLKADVEYVNKQYENIRLEIRNETESHDKVHYEIGKQYKQIQSDLTLIKEHLINRKK